MRNKPFAKDVNLEKISDVASDMSGADLESIFLNVENHSTDGCIFNLI